MLQLLLGTGASSALKETSLQASATSGAEEPCLPGCLQDATKKRGYRLVGDVDFAAVSKRAAKITPVPGGVGPMTIVMLLSNTVDSAARAFAAAKQ